MSLKNMMPEKYHSVPNLQAVTSGMLGDRGLYSLSLAQLKKHAELSRSLQKPSPFYCANIDANFRGSAILQAVTSGTVGERGLYTLSLAQLKKHAELSRSLQKPSPFYCANIDANFRGSAILQAVTSGMLGERGLYTLSLAQLKKHAELSRSLQKPYPFNIRWIHGYNPKGGVINLNNKGSTTAFYAACNCGVLYNWTTQQMRILQGHKHMVQFIAADGVGKWLITADAGPENILTIWDSRNCYPFRTLFSPHAHIRLAKVALSADAKYLLTLGYHEKPTLHWWIWSFGFDIPHAIREVGDIQRDSVVDMKFNPVNSKQFALMTKRDLWIGGSGKIFVIERGDIKETNDYEIKVRLVEKKNIFEYGRFTAFTFVPATSQVMVVTNRGAILIYGYTIQYQEDVDSSNYENLRFVKAVKIEKTRINVIKNIDGIIVTGNATGQIHFYDQQLKLMYWVHGFQPDCIKGLSFNLSPRSHMLLDPECGKKCLCIEEVVPTVDPITGQVRQKLITKMIPSDATTAGKPFLVRDFIVCTKSQGIGFVDFASEKLRTILNYGTSNATAIDVHPEKDFVCIGYADGTVELFHFVDHEVVIRLDLRDHYKIVIPPKDDSIKGTYDVTLPELSVTCLKYSPSGLHLACGLNTGQLLFLDHTTIDIISKKPFSDSKVAIKEINYSPDSLMLALADDARTVCVYNYDCQKLQWVFIGKHRAHYKDIASVFFTPQKNADGFHKLLSVGLDRVMVEYDIGASTPAEEYLEILSLDRIDQTAVPLGAIYWPAPKDLDPNAHRPDLPMILVANDEFKYKIVNYESTLTLSTVLGPRYEHPVKRMILISDPDKDEKIEDNKYIIFATKNLIGLQKMPLDGNPWKHIGILAHPFKVIGMCFRGDYKNLFTIGDKDATMCIWNASYKSVDTTTTLGGGDLDPYYCLVEDGRPGWLFQEVRDLFYYVQILCQGTFSPAMRRVKDYIPVDSLPDLMRALGFYPSEFEVENLLIEARYKVFNAEPAAEIDFEEFVKLYLNHRPAFGETIAKLRNAFRNFATITKEGNYEIDRDDFIEILSNYGECFSRDLSRYLLSILSGMTCDDRAMGSEEDFSFLPQQITFNYFITYIMGLQDPENLCEQRSVLESIGSQQTTASSATTQSNDE